MIWRTRSQDRLGGRGQFYSTPAVAYGRVYIGSTDGKIYSYRRGERQAALVAVDRRLRLRLARRLAATASTSAPTAAASTRFDAATGDVKWRFQANGHDLRLARPSSTASSTSRRSTELTYALDARTGKLLWTFPDGKYAAVVADSERLYLVGYARRLWDGSER